MEFRCGYSRMASDANDVDENQWHMTGVMLRDQKLYICDPAFNPALSIIPRLRKE